MALPRRILIISDAWAPQVNGVVRTLDALARELRSEGRIVEVIGPDRFRTVPCPTYPDIRLALLPGRTLAPMIEAFAPDALHVATEGPLGVAAAGWARRHGTPFTTAFHTRFPEYVQSRIGLPTGLLYAVLRRFHGRGSGVMVATASLRQELVRRGFANVLTWSRGVDLGLFRPDPPARDTEWDLPRPVFLYAGRVATEKNIGAFLSLRLPGSKVVVGSGPALPALRRAHPEVLFTGTRHGPELARSYAGADVLVFPSVTDTFGLVMLEALACGTPVAAFPVTGPVDVLADAVGMVGAIESDLRMAALRALEADRAACRAHAERFSWRACADIFLGNLTPISATAELSRDRHRSTARSPIHRR